MNATRLATATQLACAGLVALSSLGCRTEVSQAAALRELSLGFANSQTHAVMIIVQERECLSRESDLRMIRSEIRPSHIALLPEKDRAANPAVAQFVAGVLEMEPGSHVNLSKGSVRVLNTMGITQTPVVVVRSATSGSIMLFTASAERRILRRQLLAAKALIED